MGDDNLMLRNHLPIRVLLPAWSLLCTFAVVLLLVLSFVLRVTVCL